MALDSLAPSSALVLIDLQHGITALPTVRPTDEVVANAATLATAFRRHRRPVVLVNVGPSADGGDVLRGRTDAQPPALTIDERFTELRPELGATAGDILITKRQWDAFFGTELDLQLRRRGVTSIVLGGLLTSFGVESTARQGFSLDYELVFAEDAISDVAAPAHQHAVDWIFPRLGRVTSTAEVVAALGSATADA